MKTEQKPNSSDGRSGKKPNKNRTVFAQVRYKDPSNARITKFPHIKLFNVKD